MRSKTNPVDESNRLLQQLNSVLAGGSDCNGNDFSKSCELNQSGIRFENNFSGDGAAAAAAAAEAKRSQFGFRSDSSTESYSNTNNNNVEDLNDPAKVIGRVGEEHMRNVLFFLGFMAKFLQLVVASALLILAIEWQPLHSCLKKHLDGLFLSFLALGLLCAGLLIVKFRGRFLVVLIVNMLFIINFFWYMVASSFDYLVFSPYWIVLCAVTQTAACLFLSVLVYFQKATYKGCAIYAYATLVPLLFLVLSQPYYFWWYLKLTGGDQEGSIEVHSEDLYFTTIIPVPEEAATSPTAAAVEYEQKTKHEMIMSYSYYMINVCSGIGLATVMTFEMVAWSQYSVRGLKFKTGTGILSGSFTALADNDADSDATNIQPVNL